MSQLFPEATTRNQAPYRNDVVGSFLRTDALKQAREDFNQQKISREQLREVTRQEVKKLVELQKKHGLHAVSDGEFSRAWWHLDFLAELDGMDWQETEIFNVNFTGHKPKGQTVKIVGNIDFSDNHSFVDAYRILKEAAGDYPTKFTIPAPNMLHIICCVRAEDYQPLPQYQDEQKLYDDIANAYIKAMNKFYEMGLRNLQLDDTSWGQFCAADKRKEFEARGFNLDELAEKYVALLNRIVDAKPADMSITMHICRGNFRSSWFSEGSYAPVAEVLFGKCRVDGFFLEYDTERAGGFEPLRYIKDQQVVLGLITSKFGDLEDKNAIIARIQEAAKIVPINQLCLSPQCGFASTEEGNILTEEAQWAKLDLIKEIAEEVWG
ncbi:5-methyltetrahydropteroyltriglutamate--homocysteine S-methyltransferase [Mannheimia sp. AT1]|uniref:5-methyltetrahydropteroyltriglutamate--homocysteine S-methyltransferase n=1 Tax=Mannheimia cairinae TaxID=3025936 RepID=A0ABT5MLP8_9PAST|nr:5-methyltetrahydropteroyltriglutamate--homocysteine S-methyltransferase [Mannheimia cairinae]MDD0823128.1 5-methyltetrahydropteroyltriglutamate--homocysteine S-methyltransferase [Mannheimia cairinae]MDD0825847.1 5-methyltetrahydropteroyltriglutamate--homocysteine S-methyltransferase [Mannheimia cairinae]